jgi:hypothetical protein
VTTFVSTGTKKSIPSTTTDAGARAAAATTQIA